MTLKPSTPSTNGHNNRTFGMKTRLGSVNTGRERENHAEPWLMP